MNEVAPGALGIRTCDGSPRLGSFTEVVEKLSRRKDSGVSPASSTNVCSWIIPSIVPSIFGLLNETIFGGWAISVPWAPPMRLLLSDSCGRPRAGQDHVTS